MAFLDALGLTTIYTSPITITLWVLFFLNLSLVLWQRLPLIKSRIALSDAKIADPADGGRLPVPEFVPPAGRSGRSRRLSACSAKAAIPCWAMQPGFYGVKNRLAPIAFMLFHLSFFLILLGGADQRLYRVYRLCRSCPGRIIPGGARPLQSVAAAEIAEDRRSPRSRSR